MREESAVTLHGYALLDACGDSSVILKHLLGDVTSLRNVGTLCIISPNTRYHHLSSLNGSRSLVVLVLANHW